MQPRIARALHAPDLFPTPVDAPYYALRSEGPSRLRLCHAREFAYCRSDSVERQLSVDEAFLCRGARHSVHHARGLVLPDDITATFLQLAQTLDAVLPHSGENDTDRMRSVDLGSLLHEDVDAWHVQRCAVVFDQANLHFRRRRVPQCCLLTGRHNERGSPR